MGNERVSVSETIRELTPSGVAKLSVWLSN